MIVKRVQGRPVRGDGDVGRDKLVQAARRLLRARAIPEISRKAVAEAAGVTPALVSYYFSDKSSLLEAATKPVIQQRIAQLKAILPPEASNAALRNVIVLFLDVARADAHLLDHYLDYCRSGGGDGSEQGAILEAFGDLVAFFRRGIEGGLWQMSDPALASLALWGMCRSVAQAPPLPPTELRPARPGIDPAESEADLVMTTFVYGIAVREEPAEARLDLLCGVAQPGNPRHETRRGRASS